MDTDGDLDRVAVTARWTAAERARESARPDRLFVDPLADVLAGEPGHALAEQKRVGGTFDGAGFAIRTRFYDDALTDAVTVRGAMSQVVALAAGMDARPYRLDLPPATTWYELDRPGLLALKQRLLDGVAAVERCVRRPVGVDLGAHWTGPLVNAGFDPGRPTLWLAEGLIFYLEPAAVHALFDEITRLSASGSEMLVDTIGRTILDSPDLRPYLETLAEEGSPWIFGTDRPEAELCDPRGWRARAALYSDVGARLGRWSGPTPRRDTPGVPQSFLVHAAR